MKKSELFDRIIDKVCEVCEVRRATMMSQSKIQAIVDARILGVQYLRRTGMSFEEIALYVMRESAGDSELCPPMSEVEGSSAPTPSDATSLRCSRCFPVLF